MTKRLIVDIYRMEKPWHRATSLYRIRCPNAALTIRASYWVSACRLAPITDTYIHARGGVTVTHKIIRASSFLFFFSQAVNHPATIIMPTTCNNKRAYARTHESRRPLSLCVRAHGDSVAKVKSRINGGGSHANLLISRALEAHKI